MQKMSNDQGSITLIAVWLLGIMTILISVLALVNQQEDRMLLLSRRNFQLQLAAENILKEEVGELEQEWRQNGSDNRYGCRVNKIQRSSYYFQIDAFSRGDKHYILQGKNDAGKLNILATVRWQQGQRGPLGEAFSLECIVLPNEAEKTLKIEKLGM